MKRRVGMGARGSGRGLPLPWGLAPFARLALVALMAAGCTGSEPGSRRDARPPLRLALHGDPSSLDPHLQSEVVAQSVLGHVYDGLVAFDVNMAIVPALAERWDNPDDLTWRFELRPDLVFHDGRPVGVEDVVASLDRARYHPRSKISGYLVAVDSVRATGERTVEVRTGHPYPILLNKLAYVPIVPADAPEVITQPIGTGPYRLVAFEPGEMVELVAFEAHWSGPPPEPRVELVFLSDPAERIGGLLAGELDLVNELSARDVATVEQHEGLRVESRTSLGVEYLQMDVSAPPFDDPRVRHAIDLALDRRALVDEIALGQGRPVGQMVPPDVFGYDPALGPVERDLAEAHRLIVEAGYPQGLDLVLEVREGRPVLPLVRQLAEAGLRVEVVARPWSEMYPRLVSGEVPFYYGGWVATSADASDLLDHKVHTPDPERGYGASNSNRYSNPEIDRLIEALDEAATMGERRELLQEVLGRLGRDAAFVPLYTPFELYGLRADLRWRPRQDARVYAHEMER